LCRDISQLKLLRAAADHIANEHAKAEGEELSSIAKAVKVVSFIGRTPYLLCGFISAGD
jgi:hypothetical protein